MSRAPEIADELLANAAWLNRLARRLVRDTDAAEDVAQDAWLAASRSPPAADRPLRPWLAEVLRNVVRMRSRAEGRRQRWEAVAAGERGPEPPDALYERVAMQRLLVDRVMALEEPLRRVVLLRFFEERSSQEIARLCGVPAGTVRWRLHQALARLRADFDQRAGGRQRWAAVLAPGGILGKGLLMAKVKTKVTVLAALVVGVMGLVGWRWTRTEPVALRGHAPTAGLRSGWRPTPPHAPMTGVIAGVVRTTEGRPINAASVVLVRGPVESNGGVPEIEAQASTGPDGRFRFERLAPDVYQVSAMAAGRVPGRRAGLRVEPEAALEVDVVLRAGELTLAGRISDAGGGPLSGALVRAVVAPAGQAPVVLTASSDEQGAYRLHTGPGGHEMNVSASGYATVRSWTVVDNNRTRDFTLMPASRITGTVRERGSGKPVAGAEVLAFNLLSGGFRDERTWTVSTDDEGRFVFDTLEPGRFTLAARRASLVSTAQEVTLNAHARLEVPLLVAPGRSVSGVVRDQHGQPAPNAFVRVSRDPVDKSPLRTHADQQGRYQIDGLLPGRYSAVALESEHSSLGDRTFAVVDRDVVLDLRLIRRAIVEGVVLSAAGAPLADAHVQVMSRDERPDRTMVSRGQTASDEGGQFRVLLNPGELTAQLRHPPHGRLVEKLGKVSGGETKEVTLRLRPFGNARVSGRVTWHDGRAAEGLLVHGGGSSARTLADGSFTLENADAGSTRITTSAEPDPSHIGDWNTAEVSLTLAEGEHRRDVLLTLPSRGRIVGRALGPDGVGVPGIPVTASPERYGRPLTSVLRRGTAGPDGRFVIEDVAVTTTTVTAYHPDLPNAHLAGVIPGGPEVVLRFGPSGRLTGTLVDERGGPVTAASLQLRFRGRREEPRQVLDPAGRFEVSRLGPGEYTLEVLAPTGAAGNLEVTLTPGELREVRLVLRDPVTLTGRVLDETGAPLANAEVALSFPMDHVTARTGTDGTFTLPGSPRGLSVTVTASAPARTPARTTTKVPAEGEPSSVDLRLTR